MQEELENQTMSKESEESGDPNLETDLKVPLDSAQISEDLGVISKERDELRESLLRKQAEFENFKKRIDRERGEFVKFASSELLRDIECS